jgi:hypothetical protein
MNTLLSSARSPCSYNSTSHTYHFLSCHRYHQLFSTQHLTILLISRKDTSRNYADNHVHQHEFHALLLFAISESRFPEARLILLINHSGESITNSLLRIEKGITDRASKKESIIYRTSMGFAVSARKPVLVFRALGAAPSSSATM